MHKPSAAITINNIAIKIPNFNVQPLEHAPIVATDVVVLL